MKGTNQMHEKKQECDTLHPRLARIRLPPTQFQWASAIDSPTCNNNVNNSYLKRIYIRQDCRNKTYRVTHVRTIFSSSFFFGSLSTQLNRNSLPTFFFLVQRILRDNKYIDVGRKRQGNGPTNF
jgi:hypothetical protein